MTVRRVLLTGIPEVLVRLLVMPALPAVLGERRGENSEDCEAPHSYEVSAVSACILTLSRGFLFREVHKRLTWSDFFGPETATFAHFSRLAALSAESSSKMHRPAGR